MSRKRILLADDHKMLLAAFRRLLEPDHEIVGVVEDGRALIARAEELVPDIIVLDIAMPLLNGLDAAKHIKQKFPDIKLIFLTVNEAPELDCRGISSRRVGLSSQEFRRFRTSGGDRTDCSK